MCGICGLLAIGKDRPGDLEQRVGRMTQTLVHRGPDDRGTMQEGRVALGSRRLAVIDLSRAGRQPMHSEDGRVHLVFNGEVYNYRELRERHDLDGRGHVFRSRTDTEVLLHLYEELGPEMAEQLNGMFAIAIWDGRARELHLIRDRYGIKPLFYQLDDSHLRFGSEIKAILADDGVNPRVCCQALHDFLSFDYIPGTQTAFEDIQEVPPAHVLTVDGEGRTSLRRYWDLSFDVDDSLTMELAGRSAIELMDRAVRRRLIADVPIGVLLSGGLDSSAVTALMDRHTSEAIRTYSVGFEEASFNELPYARQVASSFDTVHREVTVTPRLVRELLPAYLRYIDEPYADGSAIPTYYVCQLAKDEVVVVLSGEGGDEAFAGYDTYAAFRAAGWFRRIPRFIRKGLIAPVVERLPVSHRKLSLEFRMKRFLGGHELPPPEAHLWWRIVLTEAEKLDLYTPELRERLCFEPSKSHFTQAFRRSTARDTLNRLLYLDSSIFLPDDLMVKNDRMSMAHSLEARVPFTDPELTEFMARVPPRLKMRGLRKKFLMREALRDVLPREIVEKKKVGLELPYSQWIKDELRDLLEHYLDPGRVQDTGLFRPEAVNRLKTEHMKEERDNGRALWGLLNYMMWLELYEPRMP